MPSTPKCLGSSSRAESSCTLTPCRPQEPPLASNCSTGHGFRVELTRDITSNVVRSCDELAGIHAQAFAAGNAPEVLGDFLAVPGSENYDSLRSGRLLYGIWQLRKIRGCDDARTEAGIGR